MWVCTCGEEDDRGGVVSEPGQQLPLVQGYGLVHCGARVGGPFDRLKRRERGVAQRLPLSHLPQFKQGGGVRARPTKLSGEQRKSLLRYFKISLQALLSCVAITK